MHNAMRIRAMQLRPQRDLSANFCICVRNAAMLEHVAHQGRELGRLHLRARRDFAETFG